MQRRLLCFALFWHALDIIWVGLFTVVYLMGVTSMTDTRYDRAPGESAYSRTALIRSARLHDRIVSGRDPHRDVFLGRQHVAALGTRRALGACRPRHRTDGRSPGLLPAHHTGPDNTNNVLALAFGILIVFLVIAGSLGIMNNLNDNMMPMSDLMNLQMQH